MLSNDEKATVAEFHTLINMSAKELEKWLATQESAKVGTKDGPGPSIGQQSGWHIVELMRKHLREYQPGDIRFMRRVTGFIKRHLAQRPQKDITETRWRASLMNWGHDPLRDGV